MRLVLAKGVSQYGSLRLHVDQLAAALARLGHETIVVDLTGPSPIEQLTQALSRPTDGLITFNGVAQQIAAGDVMRESGCVFASLHVDHPIHQITRLSVDIPRQALFFLDATHIEFMTAWAATRATGPIGLLPPGANELAEPVDTSDDAFARRDIPLLFSGTYRGPPTPGWRDWPEGLGKQLVAQTAERMVADGTLPLLSALRATLTARRMPLSHDLLDTMASLLPAAQQYAEAYHRHAVLTALGEAGAPMQVYGQGWEPLCARYPSFRHGGVGSFQETLHLLRRARIALNINNGFIAGGHERVFTAMCAGACVFSDASAYYAQAFEDGREIITYGLDRLGQASERLLALMDDLPAQAAIARAGYRRAMADHRWDARAPTLLAAIEAAR